MDVRLRSLAPRGAGQEIKLPSARFLIGRDEDCHLRPKSDLVSRQHCMVLVDDDAVVVRDLGSRNGTYVNDQRIVGEQLLAPGDRLRVGPLEFEVRIAATTPGAARTVGTSPEISQKPIAAPNTSVQSARKVAAAEQVAAAAVPAAAAPAVAATTAADDLEAFYLQALGVFDNRSTPPASQSKPAVAPRGPATATQKVVAQAQNATAQADGHEQVIAEETETIASSASGTQILRPTKGSSQHAATDSSTASNVSDGGATNDEQSGAEGAKVPPPKGIAGKLPFPRTTTKDSRSAAADTLRKFFNRR